MTATAAEKVRPGRALAEALDVLWDQIQIYHPDVPDTALFVSPGAHRLDTEKFKVLGHFARDRWQRPGDEKPMGEVVVVAEWLARGGAEVLETCLHEGAHALAAARGLSETSQEGRYHSLVFKSLAEELGLVVEKLGGFGWAKTSLAEGTAERYSEAVAALDAAVIAAKAAKRNPDEKVKRPGPVKATCKCDQPRIMRISASVLAAAPIKCLACDTNFRAEVKA